MRSNTI